MAEAKLNREYALRIVGVGALMFVMCVWSLYDGFVGWPNHNRNMARARAELLATNLTAEAWVECDESGRTPLAAAFARVGGSAPGKLVKKVGELRVPENVPDSAVRYEAQSRQLRELFGADVYSPHDLQSQSVQAVITFLAGVLAWLSLGLKARRRFVADERGLRGSGFGGGTVEYGAVASVDWSKWDEKGIVGLVLKDGRRVVLDGWHFAGMTGVVDEIVRHRPDLGQRPAQQA